MDNNFLIWSCNRKKFAKILAAHGEYKERIGRKLNSEWFIMIKFFREYIYQPDNPNNRPYEVELDFYLFYKGSLEPTHVIFKILTNTIVQKEGELFTGTEGRNHILAEHCISNIKSYMIDVILTFPSTTISENVPVYPTVMSKDCNLKTDLVSMIEKERFPDVILQCHSESLKAHKSILSARSPVFEAMFNSAMLEKDNDMVVIEDLSPTIFRYLVYFIYSGEVQIASMSSACDLLYAAEKYQLKGLKDICNDYLKSGLTIENSIQVLEIADLYDGKLKRHAMSIVKDHFEDLESTKEWAELKLRKPVLAVEVYSFKE